MFRPKILPWWNCLFFLAVIVLNILAQALPLGGASTGELSTRYSTLLTPAGYAFMIWNVIYVLVGCSIVYLYRRRNSLEQWMRSFTLWFIPSCLFNMGWLLLWHHEYLVLSFIAMILLLVSLAGLYRLTRQIERPTLGEIWFLRLPFALYTGWIIAAVLVNLQVTLQYSGLFPELQETATAVVLLIIGVIAVVLIGSWTRDGALPLPIAWGYAAIAVKHSEERIVLFTSGLAASILLVFALALFFIRSRERD